MKIFGLNDFEGNFSLKRGLDQGRVQWWGFMLKVFDYQKVG